MSCTICNAKITILFKSHRFFAFFLHIAPEAYAFVSMTECQNSSSNFFNTSSNVDMRAIIVPLLFTSIAVGKSVMP